MVMTKHVVKVILHVILLFVCQQTVATMVITRCVTSTKLTLNCTEPEKVYIMNVTLGRSTCADQNCCPSNSVCLVEAYSAHFLLIKTNCHGQHKCAIDMVTGWCSGPSGKGTTDYESVQYVCSSTDPDTLPTMSMEKKEDSDMTTPSQNDSTDNLLAARSSSHSKVGVIAGVTTALCLTLVGVVTAVLVYNRSRQSSGQPLTQAECADPNASIYDIIAEPPSDKPTESFCKDAIILPPGNKYLNQTLPDLSPGELPRRPNEKDYDYAYGHMVTGSGREDSETPGSGNKDDMYAEIDEVQGDTECLGSQEKSTDVTYSQINDTCDTPGALESKDSGDNTGDSVHNDVDNSEIVVDNVNLAGNGDDTMDLGDTLGNTAQSDDALETSGDTSEDNTMMENDLYSMN